MSRFSPRHRGAPENDDASVLARARRAGLADLRATLSLQILRTVLKLVFAACLARLAGSMIELGIVPAPAAAICVAALFLSAYAGFVCERRQAAAEAMVAQSVRVDARKRLEIMPVSDVQAQPLGALVAGLQRYPESLAALVIGHRAAALMLGIGPLLAVAAILVVSWEAALALLLASPLMIVFFVFVGGTIHTRAAVQEKAFGQLAAQFEDRVRTLPTILAGHGMDRERGKLEIRMRAYADSTMGVLKVAFLNAGIIDFFSSLSIAVLAVFLGLGHLKLIHMPGFSDLRLWQSLFILMLAPEFFAPFRRYAEQYHAKAEGDAAAIAFDAVFGVPGEQQSPIIHVPELDRFNTGNGLHLPRKGLVAITGPSGSGKSTLLRRLAGIETSAVPVRADVSSAGADWISTDIVVPPGSLAEVLSWGRRPVCPTKLLLAASRVGLLDEAMLPGGLNANIQAGGENLSGGQHLRIGTARALLSKRSIFADEPTAKLDAVNAVRVRLALFDCARERLVVVATHDPELARSADMVVDLQDQRTMKWKAAI